MTPQEFAGFNLLIKLSGYVDMRVCPNGLHSSNVAQLGKHIAKQLKFSVQDVFSVYWAALLHDIGKIGIPDHILTKPGPLSDDEWKIMKLHPIIGANLVKTVPFSTNIAPMIHYHQERYDGSGYPLGLRGEQIPIGARILAVVDAYEAMTSDRVYRKALRFKTAMQEIQTGSGKHFDPLVTSAFFDTMRIM